MNRDSSCTKRERIGSSSKELQNTSGEGDCKVRRGRLQKEGLLQYDAKD